MTSDAIGLIFTAITCSAGATWLLRSAIAELAKSLADHVLEDAKIHAKVIQLEERQTSRRRR